MKTRTAFVPLFFLFLSLLLPADPADLVNPAASSDAFAGTDTGTDAVGDTVYTAGLPDYYGPGSPQIKYAGSAALLDYETGTLLYGHNQNQPWAPASLTKLMTIYTALDAMEEGRFDLDVPHPVSPAAWASAMPPGSSLMFLGPDQLVSGRDLFRGLMISSGNDAAVEVALRVAGSVSVFARDMNATSLRLGFRDFYFEEPAGLSGANRITAEGFARFTGKLIARHPELLTDYASVPSFTYPEAQHYPGGKLLGGSIRQFNRNTLIQEYEGADGLKTGFIEESGYNVAATAKRDDRRLIVVVLGVDAASHTEGGRKRSEDAETLLDWGFENYRRVAFAVSELEPIAVWGGRVRTTLPVLKKGPDMVLPLNTLSAVTRSVEVTPDIWAPADAGHAVGTVLYSVDGHVVAERPVVLAQSVEQGSLFTRLIDRIRWFFRGLVSVFQ